MIRRGGLIIVAVLASAAPALAMAPVATNCEREAAQAETSACEQAVAGNPSDLASQANLAKAHFLRGNYQRALEIYRFVAQQAPNQAKAHYDYGTTLVMLHQYLLAVPELQRTIDIDPKYVDAYRISAIAFNLAGKPEDAHNALLGAAKLGSELEMFQLAENYELGVGTKRDPAEALHWLVEAAKRGHIGAMDKLAEVYATGALAQAKDASQAEAWKAKANTARLALGIAADKK
jgi:TPR repeat protein